MNIKHRIYKNKYKRSAPFIKKKQIYKKFTGVESLFLDKPETVVDKPLVRRKFSTSLLNKKLMLSTLLPIHLTSLPNRLLVAEIVSAKKDVKKFKNFASPEGKNAMREAKNFKAFLPRHVWLKMSASEKQAHLQKRKDLIVKGMLIKNKNIRGGFSPVKNIIKFSTRSKRLLLNKLSQKGRRNYLKKLVYTAALDAAKNVNKKIVIKSPSLIRSTFDDMHQKKIQKNVSLQLKNRKNNLARMQNKTYALMNVTKKTRSEQTPSEEWQIAHICFLNCMRLWLQAKTILKYTYEIKDFP